MNYKYSLCFLYLHYSDTRQIRQCNLPLHDFHTLETVIGYQQAAIQIGKVHRRRKLRSGRNGAGSFSHAAHHHFHPQSTRQRHHFHASRMPVHFINLILIPVKHLSVPRCLLNAEWTHLQISVTDFARSPMQYRPIALWA